MDLLCRKCDRSVIDSELEYNKYIACLRKPDDKSIYIKYTIYNVNINEFDKISNYYITTHNKNFGFYYINCEFGIQFDNNYTANIEINYHYNTDYINIKRYLLFYIDSCEFGGFKFSIINHMIINTIGYKCNMSYEYYINNPMPMVERRIILLLLKIHN